MRNFIVMLIVGFALFLGVMAYGIARDVTTAIEEKTNEFNQLIERVK